MESSLNLIFSKILFLSKYDFSGVKLIFPFKFVELILTPSISIFPESIL